MTVTEKGGIELVDCLNRSRLLLRIPCENDAGKRISMFPISWGSRGN